MRIKTKILIKNLLEDLNLTGISYEVVGMLIEDIMKHENVLYNEIKKAGKGASSCNLKIGGYILKIGRTRSTPKMINHHRILQPVIRREIPTENGEEKLFIEVQNEVEADWQKKIKAEEVMKVMYQIYKEIREAGLVWTDVRISNVGRLKKPNKVNFKTKTHEGEKEIEPDEEATGLKGKTKKILQAGEYVIIDTEHIYEENEFEKEGLKNVLFEQYYENFEKRYQREKNNRNQEKQSR